MELSHVIVEVTQRCNLDCRYCYNVWKAPAGRHTRMRGSYRQLNKTLNRLFSVADVSDVTLSGGEPFGAERFLETILLCRLRGKRVNVITNGGVATVEELTQAHELGVSLFELPLHSTAAGPHDAMTGKEGSWAVSRRAMEHLLSLGANVAAVVVITRLNADGLSDTLAMLAGMGVNSALVNRFNVGGNGIVHADSLAPDQEQLERAFAAADRTSAELGLRVSSGVCTPRCVLDPDAYPNLKFSFCRPELAGRPLTLDVAGNLRYCNHSPVFMANVFDDDFETFTGSAYVHQWHTAMPPVCEACGEFEGCFAGCRAAAEQLGLGLAHGDPVIPEHTG